MKKVLLFLALVCTAAGMYAQSWQGKEPAETDFNSSTVIYARLTTNLNIEKPNFVMGAFIDGTCRASVVPTDNPVTGNQLYVIRVWGDRGGDKAKSIVFKVCDTQAGKGLEYKVDQTIPFNDELTYGAPSQPVVLTLTAPLSYTLTVPEISAGVTYDLKDFLTIEPKNATLPDNLVWTATQGAENGSAEEYVAIDNEKGTMTTLKPGEGITLTLSGGTAGQLAEPVTFDIIQHATSIKLNVESFRVNKGDTEALMAFLMGGKAYTLEPEDNVDSKEVKWELRESEDVCIRQNEDGTFTPIKAGTAYMRPYIIIGNKKLVPADGKWIAIEVYVPVTAITYDSGIFGEVFKANVGDVNNLYTRLAKTITVAPDDATDKGFDLQYDGDLLTKQGKTTFTAVKAGEGVIKAVATSDETVTTDIRFAVEQPATKWEGSPMLYLKLKEGKTLDITDVVKGNITLNGIPYLGATVTLTNSKNETLKTGSITPDGNQISEWVISEVGDYTVSIKLTWNDYDAWDGSTQTCPTKSDSFNFQIVVRGEEVTEVASFLVVYNKGILAGGQNGTITFKVQPDDADLDYSAITVQPNTGLPAAWKDAFTWKEVSHDLKQMVFEYGSTIPLIFNVTISKGDKNYPIYESTSAFAGVEIGYNLEVEKGWSWRTNPWGSIASNPSQFLDIYSNDLVEIRTQQDLLFNDTGTDEQGNVIGLFGTLLETEGLAQDQSYKLNMNNAREVGLHNPVSKGVGPKVAASVTLEPGWNWVGNPYFFNRQVKDVIKGIADADLEGMVIIGKNGSSEFSEGAWSPTFLMEAGQGYIIKNPTQKQLTISFPSELTLAPADDVLPANAQAQNLCSVWTYDASRFMNNMTIVTVLEGVENPEDYTVGAFVGDECRGEGFVEAGKAYITVHCNAGERVSFKLYNTLTGDYANVVETLSAQRRIGSVKAPILMHSKGLTGIDSISDNAGEAEAYDLTGRRIEGSQHGVSIRRASDGAYRKVLK